MPLFNSEQISNIANLQETLDLLQKQVHPGYVSGRYYFSTFYTVASYVSFAANYVFYTYFYVAKAQAFNRIGTLINTTGVAGSMARLGIYNVAAASPTTLVLDAGNISIDTASIKEIIIDIFLQPGWYAFAYCSTSSTATVISAGANSIGAGLFGVPSITSNPTPTVRSITTLFGSFPPNASAINILISSSPLIYLKAT